MVAPESTRNLLLANAATAIAAIVLKWPIDALLWPYWIQSVVIGWYSRKRILALHAFSTENFTMNDQPVPETPKSKRQVANFFALHYGFFHVGYFVFLMADSSGYDLLDRLGFIAAAVSFVMAHQASFKRNIELDAGGKPNIGTLMFLPYARIVPMHLMILVGSKMGKGSVMAVLIFVVLKTGADVLMHYVEHRILQKNSESRDSTANSTVGATRD